MKQSIMTGASIFLKISNATKELNEVGMALAEIADTDGLGTKSLPHKIMSEKYKELERELIALNNTQYVIPIAQNPDWLPKI